jgi:hypothetical protein
MFNYLQAVKRSRVEIAFGLAKGRWAILRHGVRGKRATVFSKIEAAFALHNYVQVKIGVEDTMQRVASQIVGLQSQSLSVPHASEEQDTQHGSFEQWRDSVAAALYPSTTQMNDDIDEVAAAYQVLALPPDPDFRAK